MHSSTTDLYARIADLEAENARLKFNEGLGMLNATGLSEAIRTLPDDGTYTVIFADVDRLKALNSATGSHFKTNTYLARGFKVRDGEIAGQLYGDELVFIVRGKAEGFIARIARQLRIVPLTNTERRALLTAGGREHLTATFAAREGVTARDVPGAIELLSAEVLSQKARRDAERSLA